MTSFLRNSIIFLVVISFTILQSCVTDKSRNSNIPVWSEIEQKAKNNKITIAIESGITSYSGNFTNDLIDYFKSKYGIEIEIKLIQPNHLSNTECDIIYSTRSKISSLYKNNLLVGPFKDQLPNDQYLFWDTYYSDTSKDILDEHICTWGNVDVTYYRADANNISIPGSMLELEQIVNANPYKYSIGKGRASLKLFANLIEEVAQKENLELSKYDRDTFKKLKYILDSKLESIKSNFWRKGEANFHQLGIPIAIQIKYDKDTNRTLTESIDKKDYLCLAIPKKVNNLETALFVINELCAPKMRMKRVDSILKEQLTVDDSLPENIDSNYIIRYYDDFKYCKE